MVFKIVYTGAAWLRVKDKPQWSTKIEADTEELAKEDFIKFYPWAGILSIEKDYEPYGDEWKKELMKLNKTALSQLTGVDPSLKKAEMIEAFKRRKQLEKGI
ncbi:hypothetical protein [Litoribacter populi]|uniref:hypothetical protein n=1 Tax=Litoribacter populi TaxID=2598460 RepID=UPI0011803154|nr:hypothetical protein [Litoribacter populi]